MTFEDWFLVAPLVALGLVILVLGAVFGGWAYERVVVWRIARATRKRVERQRKAFERLKSERSSSWSRGGPVTLLLLLFAGCGSQALTAEQQGQRQRCLASVELAWDVEADRLCPTADVYWDDCEHAGALETQLADKQRACSEEAHR